MSNLFMEMLRKLNGVRFKDRYHMTMSLSSKNKCFTIFIFDENKNDDVIDMQTFWEDDPETEVKFNQYINFVNEF